MSLLSRNQLSPFIWKDFDDFFRTENLPIIGRNCRNGINTPYSEVSLNNEKEYVVDVHLPGFKKEDIEMKLKDGILMVNAKKSNENSTSSYSKSWSVDSETTIDDIHASMTEGLLSVTIQKSSPPEPETFSINIE